MHTPLFIISKYSMPAHRTNAPISGITTGIYTQRISLTAKTCYHSRIIGFYYRVKGDASVKRGVITDGISLAR